MSFYFLTVIAIITTPEEDDQLAVIITALNPNVARDMVQNLNRLMVRQRLTLILRKYIHMMLMVGVNTSKKGRIFCKFKCGTRALNLLEFRLLTLDAGSVYRLQQYSLLRYVIMRSPLQQQHRLCDFWGLITSVISELRTF